jgi:hypothetical protein
MEIEKNKKRKRNNEKKEESPVIVNKFDYLKWSAVETEDKFFDFGNEGGFMGLEEINDYDEELFVAPSGRIGLYLSLLTY